MQIKDTGQLPFYVWEIYFRVLKEGWQVTDAEQQKPFYFYLLTLKSPNGETDIYTLDGRS